MVNNIKGLGFLVDQFNAAAIFENQTGVVTVVHSSISLWWSTAHAPYVVCRCVHIALLNTLLCKQYAWHAICNACSKSCLCLLQVTLDSIYIYWRKYVPFRTGVFLNQVDYSSLIIGCKINLSLRLLSWILVQDKRSLVSIYIYTDL